MLVENVCFGEVLIASVLKWVPNSNEKEKTEFATKPHHSLQVGVLHRSAGTVIQAHQHLPAHKQVTGCQEILIIRSGCVDVDVYAPDVANTYLGTRVLRTGDIYIQYCGGHRFHFHNDTQFVEVKQGPYTPEDKIYFNPLAHEQTK
jgi:hypothetical protein